MPVTSKNKSGTLYLYLKGEIDHHTAPALRESVDEAILINESSKVVVLDFGGVDFMDSSGVGLVMGRYKLVTPKNKKLKLQNLSERDYRIMKMSGIEKLAEISKREG